MTPRERWEALLSGRRPDRVPCDYTATAEVTQRLLTELHCASERQLWERLGVDKCIQLSPKHRYAKEDTWHMQSLWSVWHIGVRTVDYGEGLGVYEESISYPLERAESAADVERFDWPDPGDWDCSQMRATCEEWRGYPIGGGCYEPFYLYCHLRGREQAMADLVLNPAIAEAALERIFHIHYAVIRRALEECRGLIDLVYIAEDLGSQDSLLMSPQCFRKFLKPHMVKMIELVHSFGAKAFHHDDGAIRPMLPELIEMGIDILNPVQWRCRGMEREGLARDFGAAVVFHGAVDNQWTLPFGTPAEIRQQVAENIGILAKGRGYIVAPCHNLQPNTSTEKILALYDAVREFGRMD
jgi:uroporphyrinogen decarboxylase